MNKIITLTLNPCIDTTLWVNELVPNEKLKAKNKEIEAGGGGINICRALSILEQKSTAIYFKGGSNGSLLEKLLNIDQLDNIGVVIESETRNNLIIIDETTLKEYRIGMPEPNILEHDWNDVLVQIATLHNYDFFVLSGSIPSSVPNDFFEKLCKTISNTNAKLIVDTSSKSLQQIINQNIFLLKPNFAELCDLLQLKKDITIDEIILETQNLLHKINCTAIVVSLGKDGAVLITKEASYKQPAPNVIVKSTVGAGDCMVAGLTLALSKNYNWKKVLQYGVAAGTAATLNSGKNLIAKKDFEIILKDITQENNN